VFVDGITIMNALFDIECAAHCCGPAGSWYRQYRASGPFFAARGLSGEASGWRECGPGGDKYRLGYAFDPHRTRIVNTDLSVLRAPRHSWSASGRLRL